MKKLFKGSLACLLLSGILLTSCSQPSATNTTAPAAETSTAAETATAAATSAAASQEPSAAPAEEVKFTIPLWNPISETNLEELNFAKRVKDAIPNLNVEIEVLKETEYESTMKIRNQSGELPDVFPLQQKWLLNFKDALTPIDSLPATANSLFAADNKIDGKVLGLPTTRFGEVVYYYKSVFDEYKLTPPKTWDEFIAACKTIKDGGKYVPFIMGAKDSWTDYPFNEFMPGIVAKDGDYYSKMAAIENPFTPDLPFYQSYSMIQKFYDAKVMGPDPLGVSFDQSKAMFVAKQGAMIAAGEWLLSDLQPAMNNDVSDLGTFILPVREKETDELYTLVSVEEFWCINNKTTHMKEAEAFLNFFFDKDLWYSDFINKVNLGPTVKDVTLTNPPEVFKGAFGDTSVKFLVYNAGDQKFMDIRDKIKFDVKDLGVQMIQKSDLDAMMKKLADQWKTAKGS